MNNTGVSGLTAKKKKTLSMRVFHVTPPTLTYETYRQHYIGECGSTLYVGLYIYISREISIEHLSVGLASLAQLNA